MEFFFAMGMCGDTYSFLFFSTATQVRCYFFIFVMVQQSLVYVITVVLFILRKIIKHTEVTLQQVVRPRAMYCFSVGVCNCLRLFYIQEDCVML